MGGENASCVAEVVDNDRGLVEGSDSKSVGNFTIKVDFLES